jgi:hypothetical protein
VHTLNFSKGQLWRCKNEACGSEILVTVSSQLEGVLARCTCGSTMRIVKHPYAKPSLRSLDATEVPRFLFEKQTTARDKH